MTSPMKYVLCFLLIGVHSKVKDLTCYGLGTNNTICAGEAVECKCITESPLLSWQFRNSNSIEFHALSNDTSKSRDGFNAIFNITSNTSILTFSLNGSEFIKCLNGKDAGSRNKTIIYPGTCSCNYSHKIIMILNNKHFKRLKTIYIYIIVRMYTICTHLKSES